MIRDVVLAGLVGVNYRSDDVVGDVRVIREELLGVLRQAVSAVAEARVIIVRSDARVETYACLLYTSPSPRDRG